MLPVLKGDIKVYREKATIDAGREHCMEEAPGSMQDIDRARDLIRQHADDVKKINTNNFYIAGPWECEGGHIWDSKGNHVAEVYEIVSPEKTKANEKLITAAPDLYDALDELRYLIEEHMKGSYEFDCLSLQPAREALSKASITKRSI